MKMQQQMLVEFFKHYNNEFPLVPTIPTVKDSDLCIRLIEEEGLKETCAHVREGKDLELILDGHMDSIYVLLWSLTKHGFFKIEEAFAEVHRSNMTKCWTQKEVLNISSTNPQNLAVEISPIPFGERIYIVKNIYGKVVKSPSYSPANLKQFV